MHPQCAHTVVMVRPHDFAWNEQTAADNEFQHQPDNSAATRAAALAEFDNAVQALQRAGVNVLVLENDPHLPPQPDAVFPNNWFSVWPDGRIYLYPMRTANRRREVRPDALREVLKTPKPHAVFHTIAAAPGLALEGTGALVFDHLQKTVYAARSERCDSLLAQQHARELHYELVMFDTRSSAGRAFYHTNVMLSIGERFAVLCGDAIHNVSEREAVMTRLRASGRELFIIDLNQAEQAFCANVLQLATRDNGRVIVLSQSAYDGFNAAQREALSAQGELLPIAIGTIEKVGGGSARCMLAEVF